MKIVKLTAENVKRLRAVEITPDDTVQIVTGRNAQGKTSVLDAIWLALCGGTASKETPRPIRDGEDHAEVTIDLGELVATRTWKAGRPSTLIVRNAEGVRQEPPQRILDGLVGRLAFDPLEFTKMSARAQREALLDVVDLDVDLPALDTKRANLFEARTEIGRRGKALGTPPALLPDTPDREVSAAEILDRIAAVQEQQRRHDAELRKAEQAQSTVEYWQGKLDEARRELAAAEQASAAQTAVLKALPEYPTIEPLRAELAAVEDTNRRVRENQRAAQLRAEAERLHADYDAHTAQIAELDKTKADALAAATFPVDGLGFDDSGVTLHGVPFAQASSAEQIRVSLAMAMALNPRLRVVRILDGSLLDAESMAAIYAMAAERDYQVWIERVEDSSESAVVIEDGAVA